MKPWWKKMTIIACCILCAGVVLSGIGWALGGEIVTLEGSLPDHSAATVQRVFDRLEDFVHLDILDWVDDEVQDSLQQAREDVENAMQRADDAVQKTMNISGTVLPLTLSDEQSQPLSGDITSVRINVGADRMKILPGESWELSYQLFFPEDLSYEVENGQLTLSYGWEKGRYYRPDGSEHITLTVPEDAVLQGVTVEELGRLLYTTGLHLGKVQVESEDVDVQIESSVLDDVALEAADARLRIEDSQLKALELDTLDLELNLNNLTADSISADSTDSDTTLRNVTVTLTGAGLFPTSSVFLGDIPPGEAGYGEMKVFIGMLSMTEGYTESYGPTTGTYTISYQDDQGVSYAEETQVSTEIKQPVIEGEKTEAEKAAEAEARQAASQWWISVLVAFAVIAIIVAVIVVTRFTRMMRIK